VLPEWKPPVYDNTRGIVLVTATTRRNSPNVSFWLYTCYHGFLSFYRLKSIWLTWFFHQLVWYACIYFYSFPQKRIIMWII